MKSTYNDPMSNAHDQLDYAIEDFYHSPSKENAERLARITQEYNDDDMIDDNETQIILDSVADFLAKNA